MPKTYDYFQKLEAKFIKIRKTLQAASGAFTGAISGESLALTKGAVFGEDLLSRFLFQSSPSWDDLRFPASRIRQGATQKPDFDTTNLGLLFPQNDSTEIAYIIAQLPHRCKLESALRPHIHFVQDEAQEPVFKIDYRWYKNGTDSSGNFTTITADTFAYAYVSGSILQVAIFPEIDGTGIDSVSSMLDIKLYRDDNVVSGDVLLKEFDIHYQIDYPAGSRQETVK